MAAIIVLLAAGVGRADFIVTLEQVGSNVVATGTGTINLTDLGYLDSPNTEADIDPDFGALVVGPASLELVDEYSGVTTGPSSFGSSSATYASSGSGDMVGILDQEADLFVPQGYVSGDALTSTSTFDNTTLSALGVTPGTYTWTWGSGADADSFVLEAGPIATPEPKFVMVLALGLVVLFIARRRFASL